MASQAVKIIRRQEAPVLTASAVGSGHTRWHTQDSPTARRVCSGELLQAVGLSARG